MEGAYKSDLARWLSRDPLGEDAGTNLYAYVDENPIGTIDQLGLYRSCQNTRKKWLGPIGNQLAQKRTHQQNIEEGIRLGLGAFKSYIGHGGFPNGPLYATGGPGGAPGPGGIGGGGSGLPAPIPPAGGGGDSTRFIAGPNGIADLQPTLDRIQTEGPSNPHRNDATTFGNREGRLPSQPHGYYTEYVVPTPGAAGPGGQRLVTGSNGEIYYTPDHYRTFIPVR